MQILNFIKKYEELEANYFDFLLVAIGCILFGIFGREVSAIEFIAVLLINICGLFGLLYIHNSIIRLAKNI